MSFLAYLKKLNENFYHPKLSNGYRLIVEL